MKKFFPALVVLVVAGAAGYMWINQSAVYAQLNAWKLIPQPERFTELFIDNFTQLSAELPKTVKAGDTVSFSFTVHNVEGKSMTYPYVVAIVDATGATTTIASSSIELASGQSESIPETHTFKTSQERVSFVITLTSLNQSVHFFIPTNY